MLEGLNDIEWDRLGHAYGEAGDVPDQIRALRDPDPEVRNRQGYGQLYANIFHQGTRYEASAFAVPFLLELLADPATPDRKDLLALLASLAIGYDETWLPDGIPATELRGFSVGGELLKAEALRRMADEPGDEDDDGEEDEFGEDEFYNYLEYLSEDEQEKLDAHFALAVYDAVRDGIPLFIELTRDSDPEVRAGAAYTLGWFPEDAESIAPVLRELAVDPVELVAAHAIVALGLVGAPAPAGDDRPLVRLAVALSSAGTGKTSAANELLAWTRGSQDKREGFWYLDGDLGGYASLALRQLGPDHEEAAFAALLERIPTVSGVAALPVLAEALRTAFPDGKPEPGTGFGDLSERQQALLRTLAASPDTWLLNGMNFGNVSLLMLDYGLPRDHASLAGYVA